jgi:hypothetical protein
MAGCGRIGFDVQDLGCEPQQVADSPYGNSSLGGDGTTDETAFLICTEAQLAQIQMHPEHWASYFRLGADIDLAKRFTPIASQSQPFIGSFDGKKHAISGLAIDAPTTSGVGMFASLGDGARVRDLSLRSVDVRGQDQVGGLAAFARGATLDTISADGMIAGGDRIGGVVGEVASMSTPFVMTNVQATMVVDGSSNVGGVIGFVFGGSSSPAQLRGLASSGMVRGTGSATGGLVGALLGSTLDSSSSSAIVISDRTSGGLAGVMDVPATISRSSASGSVTCTSYICGGLVGDGDGLITHSSASGPVTCGDIYCAGLVGSMDGAVEYSFATGDVMGTDYAAGLIGNTNADDVHDCYATGDVTGNDYVGGLIASFALGTVARSYATGHVTGRAQVGGLIAVAGVSTVVAANVLDSFTTNTVDGAFAGNQVSLTVASTLGTVNVGGVYASGTCTNTGGGGCNSVGMTAPSPVQFYASANAPLTSWDFANVWREIAGDFPQLR